MTTQTTGTKCEQRSVLPFFFASKERKNHRVATDTLLSVLGQKLPADLSTSAALNEIRAKTKSSYTLSRPAFDLLDLIRDYSLESDEQVMVLLQEVFWTLYLDWQETFAIEDASCRRYSRFFGSYNRAVARSISWTHMNACEAILLSIRDKISLLQSKSRSHSGERIRCNQQTTVLVGASRFNCTVDKGNSHLMIGFPRVGRVTLDNFYRVREALRKDIENELQAVLDECKACFSQDDVQEAMVLIQCEKFIAAAFALNLLCDRRHVFPVRADIVELLMKVWVSLCAYEDGKHYNPVREKAEKHRRRRKQCTEGRREVYQWVVYHKSNNKPSYWTNEALL